MRFTPAQDAAIRAKNRELLVSAAAGSGKTAVLVERIVRLIVEEGLSIDRMLIVTFTRARGGRDARAAGDAAERGGKCEPEPSGGPGRRGTDLHHP